MKNRHLNNTVTRPLAIAAALSLLLAPGCSDTLLGPDQLTPEEHFFMFPSPVPDMVTVEFAGTVTAVNDPAGDLEGRIGAGDPVSGLLVYDETATDQHQLADLGRYRFQGPQYGIAVGTVGLAFASHPNTTDITIRLINDKQTSSVKDQFEVKSVGNREVLPGVGVAAIDILLVDETATALSSDALAGQRPDNHAWQPTRTLTVTGVDGWTVEAQIDLTRSSGPSHGPKDPIENLGRN
jgi:hypothetical protein